MADLPIMWYVLMVLVAIFGVSTWLLNNFSDKENLKKLSAFSGIICMISLLYLTWNIEGI